MGKKKEYYTTKTLAEEALARAKTDPLWVELTAEKCPLEYGHLTYSCGMNPVPLVTCALDICGCSSLGTNEGVYGDVVISQRSEEPQTVINLKCLARNKECFLAMQQLVGLIAYYGMQIVNENLDRFD
jgi:hypothetical protein